MIEEESSSMKYRHFRNFMVNELGISKNDIRAWTEQTVEREVKSMMKTDKMREYLNRQMDHAVSRLLTGSNGGEVKREVIKSLANTMIDQIDISVAKK